MRVNCIVAALFVSFSGFSFPACTVKSAATISAGLDQVERHIRVAMREGEIDAVSISIFHDGQKLFSAAYGDAVTPSTLFQAASISKPVAAFTALKLVQRGLLSLERPIAEFVKNPFHPNEPFAELITLRHLLNHTSGLRNDPEAIDRKIYFKPGTRFAYSGAGFFYVQQAATDVTGQTFDRVTGDVLAALGMGSSTYRLHYEGNDYLNAAYSLATTPEELLIFFNELVSPRAENRETVHLMKTMTTDVDGTMKKGLGISIFSCGDDVGYFHTGRNFGRHHSLGLVFERAKIAISVMARGKGSRGFPAELAALAVGADLPAK